MNAYTRQLVRDIYNRISPEIHYAMRGGAGVIPIPEIFDGWPKLGDAELLELQRRCGKIHFDQIEVDREYYLLLNPVV